MASLFGLQCCDNSVAPDVGGGHWALAYSYSGLKTRPVASLG